MRVKINHTTEYRYSEQVFIEPHYLYFYPSIRPNLELVSFDIKVHPTPSGLSIRQDSEDNFYHQCWFNDKLDHVQFVVEMEVLSHRFNPFDFLLEEKVNKGHNKALNIHLEISEPINKEMNVWSKEMKSSAGHNIITFLSSFCTTVNSEWKHMVRYEEDLLSPAECFHTKSGSCRDLSWMMIQVLRHLEIPARFVSGYANNPELEEGHELHAWLEAWVDGPGWIGLDPSAGLFTNEQYVPVAASYHPSLTLPVQGSYRGSAVSTLNTSVNITELA